MVNNKNKKLKRKDKLRIGLCCFIAVAFGLNLIAGIVSILIQ